MRKSSSAPNLSSRSDRAPRLPPAPACLPVPTVARMFAQEAQLEAVVQTSALHAGMCFLTNQELPRDVLTSPAPRALATCLAEPVSESQPSRIPSVRSTASFLEMCESDRSICERFAVLFSRVRKSRQQQDDGAE